MKRSRFSVEQITGILQEHQARLSAEELRWKHAYLCIVVSDNGTELTSNAIMKWQEERRI